MGTVIWEESDLCVVNDSHMVGLAQAAAQDIMGSQDCVVAFRTTSSEDFSEFTARIPGVFCHIGTGNSQLGTCYPLHSGKFNLDESVLKDAAALMVTIVKNWFEENEKIH